MGFPKERISKKELNRKFGSNNKRKKNMNKKQTEPYKRKKIDVRNFEDFKREV